MGLTFGRAEGTAFGLERVSPWESPGGRVMGADPDWPTLLADYEAAIQEFAHVSRALTAALVDGKSSTEDVGVLLAAEARARDTVALMRMRLVNHWRSSQTDLGTLPLLGGNDEQRT